MTVSGGTIDNSIIGGTTAAAGSFTSINGESINLSADQGITLNNSETITNATDGELLLTSPKTLASGDLSVGTSLQTATIDFTDGDLAMTIADGGKVTSSGDFEIGTSLQTGTIDYTDGDNAMTIEDGGGVTFPQEAQFTSGLQTAGSLETATIDYTCLL